MFNNKRNTLTFLFVFLCLCLSGQVLTKNDIEIKLNDSFHPGRFVISYIKNNSSDNIIVRFTNEYGVSGKDLSSINLKKGEQRTIDITCNIVEAKPQSGGKFIDIIRKPKPQAPKEQVEKVEKQEEPKGQPSVQPVENKPEPTKVKQITEVKSIPQTKKSSLGIDQIIPDFNKYLESEPFLSFSSIKEETLIIDGHIKCLSIYKDKKERDDYIQKYQLVPQLDSIRKTLDKYTKNSNSLITEYLKKYGNKEITNEEECFDSLQKIITDRLEQRKANSNRLSDEVNTIWPTESFDWKKLNWRLIGICVGGVLLLVILIAWFRKANKNTSQKPMPNNDSNDTTNASSGIVVIRPTTSVLRKQSIEDVVGNNAYLEINCKDFCEDSAVRKMYIKNTCIKDIYNLYAEDLRNPNNPKEDGCMVLGRWVHDEERNEYSVSLEHIVLPGDDAVFTEYELNFGGKIKLKVTEKLKKLRKETNLQYDLTCWVHSHPGLGVFFSNSDSNVQMQLKHPTHPNFLTAIVIDILTPQQEMGIFTFKHDSSINSKADLKKMYSLESLYKWAVESERDSFKPEDYFNTLANAKSHDNNCRGIELSNGAIIDMGMLVAEQKAGVAGMVHGFSFSKGVETEYIVAAVSRKESIPDNELVGCFIIASHCSIPSIRKAVSCYLERIQFVLVYTTTDDLLTSIPVINYDICTNENYYGEQKLEDLKIWTRRKR